MTPESKQAGYPWDVWQTALQAEADIRNEVDHPFDIIAKAIQKVLAARAALAPPSVKHEEAGR